MSRSRMEYY